MLNPEHVSQILDDAGRKIASGNLDIDPQRYLGTLWAEVYEAAPQEMQPDIYGRLVEFSAQLGLPQPTRVAMRLASPQWDMFVNALDEAPEYSQDGLTFWRYVDHAKEPLLDGLSDDDALLVDAAVQDALRERGLPASA